MKYKIAINRVLFLVMTLLVMVFVGGSSAQAEEHPLQMANNTFTQEELKNWVLNAMADMRATEPGPDVPWADTYDTTAAKIAEAAANNPLLNDPLHTASTMVVIGWHESRYRPDVVGDHGASFGLFQVNAWTAKDVGCSKEDLLNPNKSAECALKLLHVSFSVCKRRPITERLAQYAYGHDCDHRLELSRYRMKTAAKLVKKIPLVHLAAPVVLELLPPIPEVPSMKYPPLTYTVLADTRH
jgi:hypothetical protein